MLFRFFRNLWNSARRPAIFKRCLVIAVSVGTILTLINQGDVLLAGNIDQRVALKTVLNYVVPFIVSNLGALSATR